MSRSPRTYESPIVTLDKFEIDYEDDNGRAWVCKDSLSDLFELEGAERLCLFSSPVATKQTYRTRLWRWGRTNEYSHTTLAQPIRVTIFRILGEWLDKQIAAGRPHIGVRIIK